MEVSRQHVVHILRVAGLPDLADEAQRVLPDPVEYDHAARFLAQYGITNPLGNPKVTVFRSDTGISVRDAIWCGKCAIEYHRTY